MHARTSVRPCHRAVLVHTQSTDGLPATRTRRRVHDGQAMEGMLPCSRATWNRTYSRHGNCVCSRYYVWCRRLSRANRSQYNQQANTIDCDASLQRAPDRRTNQGGASHSRHPRLPGPPLSTDRQNTLTPNPHAGVLIPRNRNHGGPSFPGVLAQRPSIGDSRTQTRGRGARR